MTQQHNKSRLADADAHNGSGRKIPNPLKEEIRQELATYRLSRGLTYKRLAMLIGVDYSTLYRGLRGLGLHDTVIWKCEHFLESLHAPKL